MTERVPQQRAPDVDAVEGIARDLHTAMRSYWHTDQDWAEISETWREATRAAVDAIGASLLAECIVASERTVRRQVAAEIAETIRNRLPDQLTDYGRGWQAAANYIGREFG